MNEQKVLILMRGTPGSGKSYRAKQLAGKDMSKIFSTDDKFEMDPRGYRAAFAETAKRGGLGGAHKWNQDRVREALRQGVNPIIVDNTNLTMWEVKPYVKMAYDNGYEIRTEESESPWWEEIKELLKNKGKNEQKLRDWASKLSGGFKHGNQIISNVHGVPSDVIMKMFNKYQPYTSDDIQNYLASRESR